MRGTGVAYPDLVEIDGFGRYSLAMMTATAGMPAAG